MLTPDTDTLPPGLTAEEVAERVARGQTNRVPGTGGRTYADIVRRNVFTLFNAILGALLVMVLVVGSPADALFGVVLVTNVLVGIVQEVRAKRTLDRLSVLYAPRARVIRDGQARGVPVAEVVLDDLLDLRPGDQIAADAMLVASGGLEVDESLLTGESRPVSRHVGDPVLSGSFVVAGQGQARATQVGPEAYANRLSAEAKRFRAVTSELRRGTNRILEYVLIAMVPVGLATVFGQLAAGTDPRHAVIALVAALESMVPQGLVLLMSVAFAVSAVRLARANVLVQELAAVEVLARVDTLCFDKTGTLTEPGLTLDAVEPLEAGLAVDEALATIAATSAERDDVVEALIAGLAEQAASAAEWRVAATVPFSSDRRWSATTFADRGTWVLGAPDVLLRSVPDEAAAARVRQAEATGLRVLLLAHAEAPASAKRLPTELRPVAVVTLVERLRPDAGPTLRYFLDQGVALKVASGDSTRTVAAIAARAGLPEADKAIDARDLPADPAAFREAAERTSVFGRVDPHRKRELVGALQADGHVVGMTGDGVNDVLAVKQADLGIAMASGAGATRAVAPVVLLDGRFATLPRVLAEGRRVTANIERVAKLFLTKTVYAVLIAAAIGALRMPFPFLPRHLTLVGTLTIGIPSFLLALAPNARLYRPGYVRRVMRFAVPAGAVVAFGTVAAYVLADRAGVSLEAARTSATLSLALAGLWVLAILMRPLDLGEAALLGAMAAVLGAALAVPAASAFLALALPPAPVLAEVLAVTAATIGALEAASGAMQRR